MLHFCQIMVLYVFFSNDVISDKPMTPLGKVVSNIDELTKVKSGDIFSLYFATG